jgi:hypothetical protein
MQEQFYRGLAEEMAAKLRRIASFVSHAPSIGSYHEEALRSMLRSMLSDRFTLRHGFAYDAKCGASQQGDILIVDENHPGAYFFREGDFAIVSPEALVSVIEVKTRLNKTTFLEAMQALYSFRKALARANPTTFLFSYESAAFNPNVLDTWYAAANIPDELRNYPFAIFSLDRGVILLTLTSEKEWFHVPIVGEHGQQPKLKSLSLFLQTIRKSQLLYSGVVANPFTNALLDGLQKGEHGYKFSQASKPKEDTA